MTHDCRLGWPAALAHTEPDDVRVRRTAPPVRLSAGEQALRRERDKNATAVDLAKGPDLTATATTLAGGRIVALKTWDRALSEAEIREVAFTPRPSTSAAPVFKVGDRVRVRPGYISGDPYGPGTVVSIGAFVDVVHDYGPERPVKDKPAGWCEGNIEHLPTV